MAIFGKDNSELLHQILRELGELRQQVSAQQHAIDQARQDTAAAITANLSEIRAVVRDGLARSNDTIGDPLARISSELMDIRVDINDLGRNRTVPAQPATEAASGTTPAASNDELLRAAAGISAAELQMHRDTWAFLIEHTAGDRHFHVPGKVEDKSGAVIVHVSGPSIVAGLTSLQHVSSSAPDAGTRAIASHLHARLTETVQAVIDQPHRGDGAEPVRIIIDDRAKPADEETVD